MKRLQTGEVTILEVREDRIEHTKGMSFDMAMFPDVKEGQRWKLVMQPEEDKFGSNAIFTIVTAEMIEDIPSRLDRAIDFFLGIIYPLTLPMFFGVVVGASIIWALTWKIAQSGFFEEVSKSWQALMDTSIADATIGQAFVVTVIIVLIAGAVKK